MKFVLLYLGRKGGAPVYALQMAKALSSNNDLLLILSSYSTNIEAWRIFAQEHENVSLFEVRTYETKLQFCCSFLRLGTFYSIISIINRYSPDAVYSVMTHFWEFAIFPFIKSMKIKTIHDVNMHLGDRNPLMQYLHDKSMKLSDKIVILSNAFIPDVMKKGVKRENIGVIPHANYSYYSDINPITGSTSKTYYRILFFGRIVKYKGLDILLSALKNIVLEYPQLILRIVGSGDIEPYMKDIALLHNNIEIVNRYVAEDEVSCFFKDVDFLVLPYIEATQSGVIPLSYSLGKPVIATNVGGIPEQIFENTGILIEPNDVEQLEKSILKLLKDDQLRLLMSNEAKSISKTELSWDKSALLLEEYTKEWLRNR